MRILLLSLLLTLTTSVNSQGMPAGLQEALDCMESLDQEAMEQLAEKGKDIEKEIKAICESGDEEAARKVGIKYALEMKDNEVVLKLMECGEIMEKAMPGMEMPEMPGIDEITAEAENICDSL